MIFLCFPSPRFGVSRRKFKKMHPPAVISGRQTITLRRAVHKRNLIESIDPLLLSARSSEVAAPRRAVVEVVRCKIPILQHGIDRHNATPMLVSSLPAINDLCADAMKS